MRRAVALLAAALLLAGLAGCGGSGAEPGAPKGATVVLDFVPNAVHTGIYAAAAQGFYKEAGIDLHVQVPGESTDAPKLLAAGRTQFAILDITDLGIAAEKGLELVGLMPIVGEPLAAVLARKDGPVKRPRDMDGHTVGVTGLPSDTAVVHSEVAADGGDPNGVDEVTIGYNAVASLAAGKVDAATGFWNDEAVEAQRQGIPLRVFKVDEYGAPRYPELVLTTTRKEIEEDPGLVDSMVAATRKGYEFTWRRPAVALDDLLAANPSLERADTAAQLKVLRRALQVGDLREGTLREWSAWASSHGLLPAPMDAGELKQTFEIGQPRR
ncbi:MAG TPA: ABC transporter substrate-binding protein [Solirubrobacterales bacterium]|nr:ABC transporter substrate-binding protein [Solirubrobacterales bacterium]